MLIGRGSMVRSRVGPIMNEDKCVPGLACEGMKYSDDAGWQEIRMNCPGLGSGKSRGIRSIMRQKEPRCTMDRTVHALENMAGAVSGDKSAVNRLYLAGCHGYDRSSHD